MQEPDFFIDIFLNPGDFYFGDQETRIRTILGSCVSITMWHPRLMIGGMCHYVLPKRQRQPDDPLDGRYAEEAMEMFLREIRAAGTHPSEYEVKVFGGGKMFTNAAAGGGCMQTPCKKMNDPNCRSVSCRNVYTARKLIDQYNLTVKGSCLGGQGHRKLFLDLWSGHVWSKLSSSPIQR